MTPACGPTMRFGFPATVLWSPPSRPSSIRPRLVTSLTNWPTRSMPRCKIPYAIWCTPDVCAAGMWPVASSTLPPTVARLEISSALGKQHSRFLCWPTLPLSRYLRKNSKPPFCSSIVCSTSSSVACSGLESMKLGHGGDSILAEFLGLDPHTVARGRQHLLDHHVTTGRTRHSGGGRKPVEKKSRHRHPDRVSARIRYRRRSHHWPEVVPANYG